MSNFLKKILLGMFSCMVFMLWEISVANAACLSNQIDVDNDGSNCVDIKFSLTTTSTASFSFKIAASGTFYIDCGDGGTLSGTGVSGNTITRDDATQYTYTCAWGSSAAHTVKFGGLATAYNNSSDATATTISFNTQTNTGNAYSNPVASITGSLGAIFPTIDNGNSNTKKPLFFGTFKQCRSLQTIPANLFSGVTGVRASMFRETFDRCNALQSIPVGLFSGINGEGKDSMFRSVFYQCTSLQSIPESLFAGVTSAASNLFRYVFGDDTALTGYIPPSAFAGLIANKSPTATDMWINAFSNTGLATSCPSGTIQYTTGYEGTANTEGKIDWKNKVSCMVIPCENNEYYDLNTEQCIACTACSGNTGATCSVSVVNNTCTYTTSCNNGYGNIQNNGAYNAYCTPQSYNITYDLKSCSSPLAVPSAYTRLEYLIANNSRINTGLSSDPTTWDIVAQVTSDTGTSEILVACSPSCPNWFGAPWDGDSWGPSGVTGVPVTTKARIQLTFSSTSLSGTVNDVSFYQSCNRPVSEFQLFQYDNTYKFIGKVWYATGSGGGVTKKFVPVKRNSDNVVGMVDANTGTFYANTGSEAFSAGPALHTALLFVNGDVTGYLYFSEGNSGVVYRDEYLMESMTTSANPVNVSGISGFDGYYDINGTKVINQNGYITSDGLALLRGLNTDVRLYSGQIGTSNCGVNYAGAPTTYTYGTGVTINGTPTREGYVFGGWCTDEQMQHCAMSQTISSNATGDKIFYAKWNVSVTYSCGDGATGTVPTDSNNPYASGATVITKPNSCSKAGHVFTGWSCGGTNVAVGETFTMYSDTTCTAQWSQCTACSGNTGATCSLSVVNNTCTYTTSCNNGYGDIQNDGEYNASCSACTPCNAINASCTLTTVNNVCTYTTSCNSGYGNIQNNGAYNASCSDISGGVNCTGATYANNGVCVDCPVGYNSNLTSGKTSINHCVVSCNAGTVPDIYTDVEYLENSGNTTSGQFIDTGHYITSGTVTINAVIGTGVTRNADTSSDYGNIFGNHVSTNDNKAGFSASYKKGTLGLWHESNGKKLPDTSDLTMNLSLIKDVKYYVDYVMNGTTRSLTINYDGAQQPIERSDNKASNTVSSKSFTLFSNGLAENKNGSIVMPSSGADKLFYRGRIYSLKLYENGVLKLDLIPAKNSNNVYGFYNKVNGDFYTNAGVGTFNHGSEVGTFSGACKNVGDGYYAPANSTNYGFAVPTATRCPNNAATNKENAASVLECVGIGDDCESNEYYNENTNQCTACTACSGNTGVTCSVSVVNNTCTYTTSCNNGYGNIQNNSAYNASCTPNVIDITWKDNTGSTINTNTCTYGQPITILEVPSRTGYNFTGWRVVDN